MKYRILVYFLYILIFIKRLFWWLGGKSGGFLKRFFSKIWWLVAFVHYRVSFLFKKIGVIGEGSWFFKRENLQLLVLVVLFVIVVPQTKVFAKIDPNIFGRGTLAFRLFNTDNEEYSLEEVSADIGSAPISQAPNWRQGAVSNDYGSGLASEQFVYEQDLVGIMAGGMALNKPNLMPGAVAAGTRTKSIEYEIQVGDSLSGIAYQYGVSVATIMWENNLSLRSILKLGAKLTILPTTGVSHTIKKGDTLKKVANLYKAKTEDIVAFNNLQENGNDLKVGEKIMVPNGIKISANVPSNIGRTTATPSNRAVPPSSYGTPSSAGFVWPSKARTITQYYNWNHHALDIAGPWQSPIYAAKAGTVVTSKCGWNSGYGCYIIIDHGNGYRTLYGHHSELLVSVGDYVEAGQTIGLMGNTGKVRGVTGIHLHFELIRNGVRLNPLGYVR